VIGQDQPTENGAGQTTRGDTQWQTTAVARAKDRWETIQKLHPCPLRIIFGEQRFENKLIRHTRLSHLAWMSTFKTDTPKPTKTNINADGSENELLGNRQVSIRRNPRAVSWFFLLRVYAEPGNGRIVTSV
jgi:hypothetical protein